eukprot:5757808-Amphidinium_carterae.1
MTKDARNLQCHGAGKLQNTLRHLRPGWRWKLTIVWMYAQLQRLWSFFEDSRDSRLLFCRLFKPQGSQRKANATCCA